MADLSTTETISYNGFTFPVESDINISSQMVYDQAQRTVQYVQHLVTVTCTLFSSKYTTTDGFLGALETGDAGDEGQMPELRRMLSTPGQELRIMNTGFGDLSVNLLDDADRTKLDVRYGPTPRVIEWKNLGTEACEVVWRCEVCIPECDEAAYYGRLMAYNYSINFNNDEQGYLTRTVSGYLEIPSFRVAGGRSLADSADNYWDATTAPAVPVGFRRVQNVRSLDESLRRLNFTLVDVQLPESYFPPNVVECRASFTTQSVSKVMIRQTATIRASYTLTSSSNKAECLLHFLELCDFRIRNQKSAGAKEFFPLSLSAENPDIYGRQAGNFSFTYMYTLPGNRPSDVFRQFASCSGLWEIPTGSPSAYQAWAKSMEAVWSPKGSLQADVREEESNVVDLCSSDPPKLPRDGYFVVQFSNLSNALLIELTDDRLFLKYDITLTIQHEAGVAKAKRIVRQVGRNALDAAGAIFGATFGLSGNGVPDISKPQTVAPQDLKATLTYHIARVGSTPPVPDLVKVGDIDADKILRLANHSTMCVTANHFGQPVTEAAGFVTYQILAVPGQMPAAPADYYVKIGDVFYNNSGVMVTPFSAPSGI